MRVSVPESCKRHLGHVLGVQVSGPGLVICPPDRLLLQNGDGVVANDSLRIFKTIISVFPDRHVVREIDLKALATP